MLNRLKRTLVESFVGAIAEGKAQGRGLKGKQEFGGAMENVK